MLRTFRWVAVMGVGVVALAGCAKKEVIAPVTTSVAKDASEEKAAPAKPSARRTVPEGADAPLFNDLGNHHYPVTTASKLAQRYFDQGLILAWGFNHAEAARSFREAQRLDPKCAMCAWGEAYVLGPNINKPMDEADAIPAWKAIQAAKAAAKNADAKEQALIEALSKRYAAKAPKDRSSLDKDYAAAMRKVAKAYPDDLEVQTLFAESLMDTMPWNYYTKDKQPKPATTEVVSALESVLAREPRHAGAIHLYIHAVEASNTPERAEAPADRLADLVPGAGHLVHMPSHIYFRVGRYQDANEANARAAKADESYISQCLAQGFYPALYYPHNVHFQWSAATFEGRSEEALKTAKKLVDFIPPARAKEFPFLQEMMPLHLFTLARFGKFQEILDAPAMDESFAYASAMGSYARGMALAGLDRADEAEKEHAVVAKAAKDPAMKTFPVVSIGSTGADLLGVAVLVLEGQIATAREDWKKAIRAYEAAVAKQDALTYSEPPPWYFPIRDALGRALLGAGRAAEAEKVYRKQLELTPRNGWSLYGLKASLEAQNKKELAAEVDRQFDKAWNRADVEITASVF